MISIVRANPEDYQAIINIGMISVEETHRGSCSAQDLREYLEKNYNKDAIQNELSDQNNIYHILYYNGQAAGFSKIVLNCSHPNIQQENVVKLDRIYLLKEFFDLKLGYALLKFNIDLSKLNDQAGIWLFTWVENKRAIDFYLKTGFEIVGSHYFKVTETHSNLNHHMFLNVDQVEHK